MLAGLFAEVAAVEALEALAVASFVLSHFVNGVVDGVEVELFGAFSDAHLVGVCTGFSGHTFFEVGFGVPHAVAEEFSEFGSVFGFFEGVAFESFSHFGIAFAVGLTAHGEVHANFGAFATEVSVEVGDHLFVATFGYADFVFGNELELGSGVHFFEFISANAAHGAFFGSVFTFVYETAYSANEFLFHITDC